MPREKNKHMDIHDRIEIQRGLERGDSLASIGRAVGVCTSTVSREVKQNRRRSVPKGKRWNLCSKREGCERSGVCGAPCSLARCRACARVRCWEVCDGFEERRCERLERAPFVCGDCHRRFNCGFLQADYSAVDAQLSYEMRLVSSREGIRLRPEQLESVVATVRRCLRRGWSIEAIWSVYGRSMPICERTMYAYIQSGVMGLANIDLPKKVKYRPRKAISGARPVDRDGRSFDDYMDLPAPRRERVVQMDTVIGARGDRKSLLTLHMVRIEFQIVVLLDEHSCEAVVGVLDWIESKIGTAEFARLFGLILTDRGIEFCDFEAIERSALGPGRRCSVYYCDPRQSQQKGSCERNHALIRRILPKGKSLEGLTRADVSKVASHLNSYPRRSLGGKSPRSLAERLLPKPLLDGLGISWLRPDQVVLRPEALRKGAGED